MALRASGTSCEVREVVLRDKPAELLQVSPKGTVPVLVLPNALLEHSLDIMLWALKQNDPDNWLQPESGTVDDMLALIRRNDTEFKQALDHYKYPSRYPGANSLANRELGAQFLHDLNQTLQQSPFLFGNRPALADVALAPFIRQFANTDNEWFNAQPWPALQAWLHSFVNSPAFEAVMHKFERWRPDLPVQILAGATNGATPFGNPP